MRGEERVPGGLPGGLVGGATSVMTRVVSRLLLLPTMMVAAGVLVKGYAEPGDGFSAGVIAALGVLLQYLAFGHREVERMLPVRGIGALSYAGLLITLAVAIRPLLVGEPVLTHWPPPGTEPIHLGTLELITAVAFDVGIFFLVFGYGVGAVAIIARSVGRADPRERADRAGRDPDTAFGEGPG